MKEVLQVVQPQSGGEGFYSKLFLVHKKGGKHRPVINQKSLNHFTFHQHIKMEEIHTARKLLRVNDWMARIDLNDAYFSVLIAEQHRKFLRFCWEQRSYQITYLPLGLSTAATVFTKILKPVMTFLREKKVRCKIYLDDLLLLNQAKEVLSEDKALCVNLLESLGFLVNYVKSELTPTQETTFLGFVINSKIRELSLQPTS